MEQIVNTDLGGYLRQMRERVRPEQTGLQTFGSRRVPGLRREEVATLAGVSQTYYTRLEQSQTAHASPQVLLSLARALRLSPDERDYLLKIGTPLQNPQERAPGGDQVSPATRMLVKSLGNVAAAVLNHRCDILSWNPLYHRLLAPHLDFTAPDHPAQRPNVIKLNFLDATVRSLYADWPAESEANVTYLRFLSGNHRHDPQLAELIGELTIHSEEFTSLWCRQRVSSCIEGTKLLTHPTAGTLELLYQSAHLQDGNILKLYYAEPNSPHETALQLLTTDDDRSSGR
ncbi:helix-turn-helix transcriptional regulator [Streptomyces sp. LaPpAH-108]|uniref:helix-turn-helix transcriptional regulator n=1 Tax=Streptomyces sp. LaPpAH-108 TaxID=1155714 RepID=UPI00039B9FD7|nr:helix-turn-helix transcriptional regulator [Streptomyces sp. LaPpAH-108]